MKKVLSLIILILITGELFSQDSINYKNGLAINAEALFVADFKLTFTHKLDRRTYFEAMVSYNIPLHSLQNTESTFDYENSSPKDPFYGYGRMQIRIGLKEYLRRGFYIGEMILYNYGHFDNLRVTSANSPSGNVDEELVSRVKNDYEVIFKIGKTFQHKSGILLDLYMGVGWRWKYLNDIIYAGYSNPDNRYPSNFPPNYPFNQSSNYSMFELHGGLQIGFGK